MVCIDCNLHGRRVHILSKQGKARGEYVFITSRPQVFPQTCIRCRDHECMYEFNHKTLLKQKRLRERLIAYVFDATMDDMLAEYGLVMMRSTPIISELGTITIYSKPCFDKKQGKTLRRLDNEILKTRKTHFNTIDDYIEQLKQMKQCKPRILIKGKT